jgi:hypothetical protein
VNVVLPISSYTNVKKDTGNETSGVIVKNHNVGLFENGEGASGSKLLVINETEATKKLAVTEEALVNVAVKALSPPVLPPPSSQTPLTQEVPIDEDQVLRISNEVIQKGLQVLKTALGSDDNVRSDQMTLALALFSKVTSVYYSSQQSRSKSGSKSIPVSSFTSDISLIKEKSEKEKKTSVSSKVPKPAIPFPEALLKRLLESLIQISVNPEDVTPFIKNNKWSGLYKDLSCPFMTLVLALLASKTVFTFIQSTKVDPNKPLHFVLWWIFMKIMHSEEPWTIDDSGLKDALDTVEHDENYYTGKAEHRDVHEILMQLLKVLDVENGQADLIHDSEIKSKEISPVSDIKNDISSIVKEYTGQSRIRKMFTSVLMTTRICCSAYSTYFLTPMVEFGLILPTEFTSDSASVQFSSLIADSMKETIGSKYDHTCAKKVPETLVTDKLVFFPKILVIRPNRIVAGSKTFVGSSEHQTSAPTRNSGSIIPQKVLILYDIEQKEVVYNLFAIILHNSFENTASGHFQVLGEFNGNFLKLNDIGSICRPYEFFKDSDWKQDLKDGYMYFYEKNDSSSSSTGISDSTDAVAVTTTAAATTGGSKGIGGGGGEGEGGGEGGGEGEGERGVSLTTAAESSTVMAGVVGQDQQSEQEESDTMVNDKDKKKTIKGTSSTKELVTSGLIIDTKLAAVDKRPGKRPATTPISSSTTPMHVTKKNNTIETTSK